jgi:hypothetical protein
MAVNVQIISAWLLQLYQFDQERTEYVPPEYCHTG